jgi:hypothetical protein
MSSQEFLFDKRIVQRNVALGLVDQKTVDKQIASLPDRESNSTISQPDEAKPSRVMASDAEDEGANDDEE